MTSAFAVARTSTSSGGILKDETTKPLIDLQNQHFASSPADTMRSIATSCEELGIDTFDIYGDFSTDKNSSYIRKFEAEVASKFGKEDAVFMPSGGMAQSIALLIHDATDGLQNRGRFICHHTSHLLLWEEHSYSKLLGIEAIEIDTRQSPIRPGFPVPPMRLSDVVKTIDNEKDARAQSNSLPKPGPTSLFLELPHRELGGKLTPWDDVLSIGELCKKEGINFHCDGARIFEASAGYGKNLDELARPFDSVYISFYKGLGAVSGAMLMGSNEFCSEARIWLRRFGGNLYTLLPYAVSCWAGYNRHVLGHGNGNGNGKCNPMSFEQKFKKLQGITKKIETETDFTSIAYFDPAKPETNMIHVYLKVPFEDCNEIRDKVAQKCGFNLFTRLRQIPESDAAFQAGYRAKFELTIGECNGSVKDDVFVQVWTDFCTSIP